MITRRLVAAAFAGALIVGCATAPQARADDFTPTRFSAEVRGHGPDVILIPGLASSRDVFAATATQLEATHRVHVLQLAGFAGEPVGGASEGAVVAPFVEELAQYIEANHLDHPALIGHSLGGFSALLLAKTHPDDVGRVMVVDALPFFSVLIDPSATAAAVAPQAAMLRDQMSAMTAEQFNAVQGATMARLVRTESERARVIAWTVASDRSVVARGMYDIMTSDLRPDLASIQTPVTIVYANDPAIAPEAAISGLYTSQYAALPHHNLVKVDQSFHFVPLDNPTAFASAVTEFLR